MKQKMTKRRTGNKALVFLMTFMLLINEGAGIIHAAMAESDMNALAANGKIYKEITASDTYKNSAKQYNPEDPLGVATHFHLFSDGIVRTYNHTNGNIATNVLDYGNNSGTNKLGDEVVYFRKLEFNNGNNSQILVFSDGGAPEALVVGSEVNVASTDNGNYFTTEGVKVGNTMLTTVLQDTSDIKYIDLAGEMSTYANLSKKLPTATDARDFSEYVSIDGGVRGTLELDMQEDTCRVINISGDDVDAFLACKEGYFQLDGYVKGTKTQKNASVVINVDLNGKPAVTLPNTSLICTDDTPVTNNERTTFEYGNVLWNFYDSAKTDSVYTGTITTSNHMGTILAPGATVIANGNLDGSIIAHDITINKESHRNDFLGLLPTSYGEPVQETEKGNLEVTITEKGTTTPVSGIKVTISGPDNYSNEVTSDASGKVSVKDLPVGSYTVTIPTANNGYVTLDATAATETKDVTANQTTKYTFELEKEAAPVPETGDLTIKVTDEKTGDPVPGAKVEITLPGGTTETKTTDSNGEIKYTNVPTGSYKTEVVEVPDGYTVTTNTEETVTVVKDDTAKVEYKIDQEKGNLEVTITEKGTTTPVSGIKVTISGPDNYSNEVTSDASGKVSVKDLPVGSYTVTIPTANNGYVTLDATAATETKDVTANQTTKYTFELEKEAAPVPETGDLTIKVTDEKTGDPVPGAKVEITLPGGTTETKTTDSNGEIKYTNVPTGSYKTEVVEVPDGYTVTTNTEETVTVVKNDTAKVEYKIDQEKGNLEVTITEKGTTTPVSGIKVTISGPDNYSNEVTTDASGKVSVKDLPVGSYTVTIPTANNGYVTLDATAATETKDVTANQTTKYTFELEKEVAPVPETGDLTIKVTDEKTGDPVPGAKVEITLPGGTTETKTTDSNGEIKYTNVPTGSYKTEVVEVPDGYTVTTNTEETVTVVKNDTAKVEYKIDQEKGNLEVTITEKGTTTPVSGIKVTISGPDNYSNEVTSDASGKVSVKDLPVGSYTVTIPTANNGYVTLDATAATDTKDVTANQTTKYTFELEKEVATPSATTPSTDNKPGDNTPTEDTPSKTQSGNLTITVVDEKTGDPVPGAKVEITYPDGNTTVKTTDANGEIDLSDVPVGKYTVNVKKVPDGYTVTTEKDFSVSVKKNETAKKKVKIKTQKEKSTEENESEKPNSTPSTVKTSPTVKKTSPAISSQPKTGDDMNITLFYIVFTVSLIMAMFAILQLRKIASQEKEIELRFKRRF